jgi:TolA-binding protein
LQPVPGARQLLADGTAARARGERAVAVGIFWQLQSRYPSSPEAEVSLISSGQLLLDRGDFAGALAAFGAYRERSPAGSLAEEALDGLARAYAGLSRFDEERRTWRELMDRFPRSAYSPRARARLQLPR